MYTPQKSGQDPIAELEGLGELVTLTSDSKNNFNNSVNAKTVDRAVKFTSLRSYNPGIIKTFINQLVQLI